MIEDQVTWLSRTNKPHRSSSNWYGLAIEFKWLTSLSTLAILLLLALSETPSLVNNWSFYIAA